MSNLWDPEDEPDGDVFAPHHFWSGVLLSLFGFGLTWTYYSNIGAGMAIVGLLLALDDVIEHATTLPTPVDELWERVIYPIVVKRIEGDR